VESKKHPETSIARHQQGKNVPAAMKVHTTIKELLDSVFYAVHTEVI
jgi:hypothetical protein